MIAIPTRVEPDRPAVASHPLIIRPRAQILMLIAVVAIAAGGLFHLIGAGSTGQAGADPTRAIDSNGRPVRRLLPAGHGPRRGLGLDSERRSGSGARGGGRRNPVPTDVSEQPGQGIGGLLDGRRVLVGSRSFLASAGVSQEEIASSSQGTAGGSGEAHVLVAVDGHLAGVIVMADELRPDAEHLVERLRAEGVRHIAMISGDRRSVAERVGRELGVDRVYADQSPEDKLKVVRTVRADPNLSPVIMVGDGINDAPALALADLGIAMGAAGATVSSETADAVITVDRIDRVADAIHAGRRALFIARQSVLTGMGLSLAAMAVAAAGYLPPVAGALFQEAIDLAVILNARRALRG
jgi:cation transport ATPase